MRRKKKWKCTKAREKRFSVGVTEGPFQSKPLHSRACKSKEVELQPEWWYHIPTLEPFFNFNEFIYSRHSISFAMSIHETAGMQLFKCRFFTDFCICLVKSGTILMVEGGQKFECAAAMTASFSHNYPNNMFPSVHL